MAKAHNSNHSGGRGKKIGSSRHVLHSELRIKTAGDRVECLVSTHENPGSVLVLQKQVDFVSRGWGRDVCMFFFMCMCIHVHVEVRRQLSEVDRSL